MVIIVYQGSKNRLAKYIIPLLNKLIQANGCTLFIDACCGGANTKYPIVCKTKYAFDNNKYLIALFDKVKFDDLGYIHIDENEYKRELEIKEWLDKNKYNGKFVILDDDVDYINKYFKDKHIVKTNNKVGLTKAKLEEIKRKLKE